MSQLPPREPPDLRNVNRPSGQTPPNPQQPLGGQGYPPPQYPPASYPPQAPLPQTGQLGQQYPPPQYPPQPVLPQTGQLGQQYPPPGMNQPYQGGFAPQPAPQLGNTPYTPRPLDPIAPPKLKSQGTFSEMSNAFSERRIEYLAWGLVVLSIGMGIILLALASNSDTARSILLIPGPLFIGFVLLASGFLQRIVFGYGVSLVTWATAVTTTSFGLTQLIALLTETQGGENLTNQVLYFFGILVVLSGMVIILQVFRSPHE